MTAQLPAPAGAGALPARRASGSRRRPMAASTGNTPADALACRVLSARGRHGELRYLLRRVADGLYVEREDIPQRGLHTVQALQFEDPSRFTRWCDDDPARFEHPHLHVSLKHDADLLWSQHDAAPRS